MGLCPHRAGADRRLSAVNPAPSAPAGSLNREVSRRFGIPVITVETSRRDPLPRRVDTQIDIVTRVLGDLGMLEGGGQ